MPSEIIGHTRRAIAEGYIPEWSHGPEPRLLSHETACILNPNDRDAQVQITTFYRDREPAGPYHVVVPACRVKHIRFNDLQDPEAIPPGTDYASRLESDVPVIVQHTRLDFHQAQNTLMTTMAFGAD